MDLQETIVLIIKREREEAIQLLTTDPKVYKELLMHHLRGTNGGGEPHLRRCLDWIWWFWTLRRLELVFVDPPRVSGILGYLQSKEAVQGAPEVGTTHWGTAGPPGTLWWVLLPSGHPQVLSWPTGCLLVEKDPQKVSLRLDSVWYHFLRCKNMQKTTTGTGHYVNKLVPKMI